MFYDYIILRLHQQRHDDNSFVFVKLESMFVLYYVRTMFVINQSKLLIQLKKRINGTSNVHCMWHFSVSINLKLAVNKIIWVWKQRCQQVFWKKYEHCKILSSISCSRDESPLLYQQLILMLMRVQIEEMKTNFWLGNLLPE